MLNQCMDRLWPPVPRPVLPIPVVLLLVAGLPSGPAHADIYRFVDKQGVEHYTNVQPQGRGWQRIIKSAKPSPDSNQSDPRPRSRRGVRPPDPDRLQRYDAHIREAAERYQLPPALIRAIMRVESNFYVDAVSGQGAMGLMQLMPRTAESMGVHDAFDPRQNVLGGSRFLRILANRLEGNLLLTIAAYNAGLGAVRRHGGVPPYSETQRYVKNVISHYYMFKQQLGPDNEEPALPLSRVEK